MAIGWRMHVRPDRRPPTVAVCPICDAVGDRVAAGGHVDREGEGRLVARVVVARKDRVRVDGCGAVADAVRGDEERASSRRPREHLGRRLKSVTRTVNVEPLAIGLAGVIDQLLAGPLERRRAARSTDTRPDALPPKSRSKCESACVARLTIVIVAVERLAGSLVAYRRRVVVLRRLAAVRARGQPVYRARGAAGHPRCRPGARWRGHRGRDTSTQPRVQGRDHPARPIATDPQDWRPCSPDSTACSPPTGAASTSPSTTASSTRRSFLSGIEDIATAVEHVVDAGARRDPAHPRPGPPAAGHPRPAQAGARAAHRRRQRLRAQAPARALQQDDRGRRSSRPSGSTRPASSSTCCCCPDQPELHGQCIAQSRAEAPSATATACR